MARPSGAGSRDDLRLDFDRRVRLEFRGSQLSSDGGLLIVRELDDALGLSDPASAALADARTGANRVHQMAGPFRQSVYGRLAGYEDANDAERLAHDPVMRQVVGARAVDGHPRHPSRHRAGIPSGTVENLVKAREVSRLGASGHPQANADGPFTRGRHGARHQDEHVFPGWRRKARTQRLQPVARDLWDGIAGTLRDVETMYHPILRIPCRSSCKSVGCGKANRAALRHSKA